MCSSFCARWRPCSVSTACSRADNGGRCMPDVCMVCAAYSALAQYTRTMQAPPKCPAMLDVTRRAVRNAESIESMCLETCSLFARREGLMQGGGGRTR